MWSPCLLKIILQRDKYSGLVCKYYILDSSWDAMTSKGVQDGQIAGTQEVFYVTFVIPAALPAATCLVEQEH